MAQHIARDHLSLALGHNPVLDAKPGIGVRIGPSRHVAGGEYSGDTCLEKLVHGDAVIDYDASGLRQLQIRSDADAGDDQIRFDARPIIENDGFCVDGLDSASEVKRHALLLVHRLNQGSKFSAKHSLEWKLLRRNDVDLEATSYQRSGYLESDEAPTDDHRAFCVARFVDDGATVSERAQIGNSVATRYVEMDRGRASRNQKNLV
jgi:hypothetical protein